MRRKLIEKQQEYLQLQEARLKLELAEAEEEIRQRQVLYHYFVNMEACS